MLRGFVIRENRKNLRIDSWLWFVYFSFTSKERRQNPATAPIMLRLTIHFECWEVLSSEKTGKSQNRLGKDVCNSLEIRINLKLAPTSTLRIWTINWEFASHETPKGTGLYLSVDSQYGLNYLGRIIASCSMRIVWRNWWCSCLHTQFTCWRPLVQVLAGGAYLFGVGAACHIWWCILILNKGEITHLVVDLE